MLRFSSVARYGLVYNQVEPELALAQLGLAHEQSYLVVATVCRWRPWRKSSGGGTNCRASQSSTKSRLKLSTFHNMKKSRNRSSTIAPSNWTWINWIMSSIIVVTTMKGFSHKRS